MNGGCSKDKSKKNSRGKSPQKNDLDTLSSDGRRFVGSSSLVCLHSLTAISGRFQSVCHRFEAARVLRNKGAIGDAG